MVLNFKIKAKTKILIFRIGQEKHCSYNFVRSDELSKFGYSSIWARTFPLVSVNHILWSFIKHGYGYIMLPWFVTF